MATVYTAASQMLVGYEKFFWKESCP